MSTDVLAPQHVIVALPPPHTRADVHALRYSAWASAVARDEPRHDTVPSASRSMASLVQALARGEPYRSSRPGYDLTLERLTFVEYREGHELLAYGGDLASLGGTSTRSTGWLGFARPSRTLRRRSPTIHRACFRFVGQSENQARSAMPRRQAR